MKPIHIVMAVLGGAIAGATVGLMLAPAKGSDTRSKIVKCLRKRGVCLKKGKMDQLVDQIEEEIDNI